MTAILTPQEYEEAVCDLTPPIVDDDEWMGYRAIADRLIAHNTEQSAELDTLRTENVRLQTLLTEWTNEQAPREGRIILLEATVAEQSERLAKLERVADTLRAFDELMPEMAQQTRRDWGGDYFDVSCKFCGADQPKRGETHETWCVVPTLKAWNERRTAALAELDAHTEEESG